MVNSVAGEKTSEIENPAAHIATNGAPRPMPEHTIIVLVSVATSRPVGTHAVTCSRVAIRDGSTDPTPTAATASATHSTALAGTNRKSTRLNSSHLVIS